MFSITFYVDKTYHSTTECPYIPRVGDLIKWRELTLKVVGVEDSFNEEFEYDSSDVFLETVK